MTCEEFLVNPEAREHLEKCAVCRTLIEALERPASGDGPSQEAKALALQAVSVGLRPVRPLPARAWLAAEYLTVFAVVAAGASYALGTEGWRSMDLIRRVWIALTVSGAALGLAVWLAGQMLPGGRVYVGTSVKLPAFFAILGLPLVVLFRPEPGSDFVSAGYICLKTGLLIALPAAALCWLVLKRGALLDPVLTGSLTGALAGLSGFAVLELHCGIFDVYHILAWHWGVVVAGLTAGMLASWAMFTITFSAQPSKGRI